MTMQLWPHGRRRITQLAKYYQNMPIPRRKITKLIKFLVISGSCFFLFSTAFRSVPTANNNKMVVIDRRVPNTLPLQAHQHVASNKELIRSLLEADMVSSEEIDVTIEETHNFFGNITVDISNNFTFTQTVRKLPLCPPDISIDQDRKVLETLRHCADSASLDFAPELEVWNYIQDALCSGAIQVFDKEVALLGNVVLDKHACSGRACGRDVDKLVHRKVESKELGLRAGFFNMQCGNVLNTKNIHFRGGGENHLNNWMSNVKGNAIKIMKADQELKGYYMGIKRHDYRSVYYTINDIYNAFLAAIYFNVNPKEVGIVLIDGHPTSNATSLWRTLFNSVTMVFQLPTVSVFRHMIWSKNAYNSDLLDFCAPSLAYGEEFREFIFSGFGLDTDRDMTCSSIRVSFISKGDNDELIHVSMTELFETLNLKYHNWLFNIVNLDLLSIKTQLEYIESTDIMIATSSNDAGLISVLLLPRHAGVIEMVPTTQEGLRFSNLKVMSGWRGLRYVSWGVNQLHPSRYDAMKHKQTTNSSQQIHTNLFQDLLLSTIEKMCPEDDKHNSISL